MTDPRKPLDAAAPRFHQNVFIRTQLTAHGTVIYISINITKAPNRVNMREGRRGRVREWGSMKQLPQLWNIKAKSE